MKIAIAVTDDLQRVSGHAGQCRHWLVYDCQPGQAGWLVHEGQPGQPLPAPVHVVLTKEQLPHHAKDDGPHPLRGVALMVVGSAGDGFIRHMAQWGAQVLLTGEAEPATALRKVLQGEALADQRFDITTTLCKLRDLFSRH